MAAESDLLRPLGMLEKLYAARQVLGIYHSVIVTATYTIPILLSNDALHSLFCLTIPGLLERHPSLCCYVSRIKSLQPTFHRLETTNVNEVVQCLDLKQEDSLTNQLRILHDRPWPAEQKSPLWNLVILREANFAESTRIYAAFVYHHVIGDGLSGLAFHKTLLQELQKANLHQKSPTLHGSTPSVQISPSTSLLLPIEKVLSFPISWSFLLRQVSQEYFPRWLTGNPTPPWAGSPVPNLNDFTYCSQIKLLTIPTKDLETLLQACKRENVSLTSLLTASIVTSLSRAVPHAAQFAGMTPYTLRPKSGTSMDEMVVQTSAIKSTYSSTPTENLWHTARLVKTSLRDELSRCPKDNLLGLLRYLSNSTDYYRSKFGQARDVTFELSNLGVFDAGDGKGEWEMESMTFTQGAAPLGPAFAVNAATVRGGILTLSITWQDGVVGEDVVDAVARGLQELPTFAV